MIPTDQTIYTINQPGFRVFQEMAETEPMCDGWSVASTFHGWVTVQVPNWTAGIAEFNKRINDGYEFVEVHEES